MSSQDVDHNAQSQAAQQWLETLLNLAGFPATVQVHLQAQDSPAPEQTEDSAEESDERISCWLEIDHTQLSPEQRQRLIGSEGNTLDAIQYLTNAILNLGQGSGHQQAYTIELDGYRARRQAELQAVALSAAEQARETGEEVELKSLSSAERRQIHTFLQPFTDLETFSRGREPDRRLVIRRLP